ncbi:MAG: HAD-IA family hydrolase [Candidatus Omnitrophica bacterium]|nr:HAD-IA family hydrolase [Candidatus Omnitrophota bacterium]
MQNRYDAIICDLGNVLINFDHCIAVKKILHYTIKEEKDIYNLFFDSPLTGLYEEGKISSAEFFSRVKESLKLDIDYRSFLPIWNDIFFECPLNIKMHNLLRCIKGKYKLIMISNINQTHFEFLNEKMDILKDFDKLVLSYEVGYRKPAPEIYKVALESIDVLPSKSLYIDDRQDLIDRASKMGIRGIVFDSESAFEKLLKELAVEVT